jgi:hypothetical protein
MWFTYVLDDVSVEINNDEDKKITGCLVGLDTLLELPDTMTSLQIEILNEPDLLRKLEVINWTPAEHFPLYFSRPYIESFINQVPIYFLWRLEPTYSRSTTDTK